MEDKGIAIWIFGFVFLSIMLFGVIEFIGAIYEAGGLFPAVLSGILISLFVFSWIIEYIIEIFVPHKCECCFKVKKGVHERRTGELGYRRVYGRHSAPVSITIKLCKECYLLTKKPDSDEVNRVEIDRLKREYGTDYQSIKKEKEREELKEKYRLEEEKRKEEYESKKFTANNCELIYTEECLYPKEFKGKYLYVSVKYDDYSTPWSYYYITNCKKIKKDDIVIVDVVDEETTAKVIDVQYYDKDSVPYPVERTKIIKKVYRKNR